VQRKKFVKAIDFSDSVLYDFVKFDGTWHYVRPNCIAACFSRLATQLGKPAAFLFVSKAIASSSRWLRSVLFTLHEAPVILLEFVRATHFDIQCDGPARHMASLGPVLPSFHPAL
jgi:hypothetical protein